MALLHIYDSSDWTIRLTAGRRGAANSLGCPDLQTLMNGLDAFVQANTQFDRILFETHGGPGVIGFGNYTVDAQTLRAMIARRYTALAGPNARVYFNGCNVAEGTAGWPFLEAAAALFLTVGGGQVFGQTSLGFANPFNGHVVHLWGSTRTLFVDSGGRVIERFEQ